MAKKAAAKINLRPLGDRVVVRPDKEGEERIGSIYVPDTAKEKPQRGTVVALGTGKRLEDGTVLGFDVAVGDVVLYSKYGGSEVHLDDEDYLVVRESDILARIE